MKLKTLILLYGLAIITLACTHSPFLKKDTELYSQYKIYSALLNNDYSANNLDQIFNSYTPEKQHSLLSAQKKTTSLLQELTSAYLSFPLDLNKEFNHYEWTGNDQGCLLINGYNNSLEPMSITVSFSRIDSWLIDDVHIEMLAPFNQFLHNPICDQQKLAMIRLKEMM